MASLPALPARLAELTTGLMLTPLRVLDPLAAPVRTNVRRSIQRSLGEPRVADRSAPRSGARSSPRATRRAQHSEPYLPPDSVVRRVHGDLPAMMIGGLSALLLQTLHPLVMAGVADHSRYQEDPLGRLRRTAAFLEATTFGSVDEARRALEDVRLVHAMVDGRSPDGRRYSAGRPDLLTWVHAAETWSFLHAYQRYGPSAVGASEAGDYYLATSAVARELGASWVPTSEEEMTAYFAMMRPTLYAGPQAIEARNFLLRGVAKRPEDRIAYTVIVSAAVGLLPQWARAELGLPSVPLLDRLAVVPVTRALCSGLRWLVQP